MNDRRQTGCNLANKGRTDRTDIELPFYADVEQTRFEANGHTQAQQNVGYSRHQRFGQAAFLDERATDQAAISLGHRFKTAARDPDHDGAQHKSCRGCQ